MKELLIIFGQKLVNLTNKTENMTTKKADESNISSNFRFQFKKEVSRYFLFWSVVVVFFSDVSV